MSLFGKCNSDKCHCPRCSVSPRCSVLTKAEIDAAIDDRIDRQIRKCGRYVDYACGSARRFAADAPMCNRTFDGLGSRVQIMRDLREHNRGLSAADRVHYSPSRGRYWRWQRRGNNRYWLRVDIHTGEVLDLNDRGVINASSTTGEVPMLSPLKLSILLWRSASPIRPYPYPASNDTMGSTHRALFELEKEKLIRFTGGVDMAYTLTPRAEVLIEAISKLPLPVQPEPEWKMPA